MTIASKPKRGGVIDPTKFYTTDAVMAECKIGRNTLREMRTLGLLTPHEVANQLFYDGAELISAVKVFSKKERG